MQRCTSCARDRDPNRGRALHPKSDRVVSVVCHIRSEFVAGGSFCQSTVKKSLSSWFFIWIPIVVLWANIFLFRAGVGRANQAHFRERIALVTARWLCGFSSHTSLFGPDSPFSFSFFPSFQAKKGPPYHTTVHHSHAHRKKLGFGVLFHVLFVCLSSAFSFKNKRTSLETRPWMVHDDISGERRFLQRFALAIRPRE